MVKTEIKNNILYATVSGKLHHQDYLDTINPVLEKIAAENTSFRLAMIAVDFDGWDPRAAFDDAKLGFKYHDKIERVAIVGNKHWEEMVFKMFSPLVKGEAQYFDVADKEKALEWIAA